MNASDVEFDIQKAIELLLQKDTGAKVFNSHCRSYVFGTENQQGINDSVMAYEGKDVLTIAGSGDQYLGAIYYGAKSVSLFDINKFSYYITFLKIASIRALDYFEFLNFFVPAYNDQIRDGFWDLTTLKKVAPYLPPDVLYFWENIMYIAKKNNYRNFISPFKEYYHQSRIIRGMPFYAMEDEFNILKNILNGIPYPEFHQVNVTQLASELDDKFDIVYLSNIVSCMVAANCNKKGMSYAYADLSDVDKEERQVWSIIKQQVDALLREDGEAVVDYRMNTGKHTNLSFLFRYLDGHIIEGKSPVFDCFDFPETDLVLTYKPSKKYRW